jgi:hypothetical protein
MNWNGTPFTPALQRHVPPPLLKVPLAFCSTLFVTAIAFGTVTNDSKDDLSRELPRINAPPQSEFTTKGFFEGTFYAPHNEYPANFGLPFKDEATARYALATDVTVEHIRSGFFGGLYLFMPMGDSKPRISYNYSADPIFLEVQPQLGYHIDSYLDVRLTYNKDFDLGNFISRHEVTPWLSLSLRATTPRPFDLWNLADLSGSVETFLFAPGLEYPATPGASPRGYPVVDFSRSQIVNARYGLGFNFRLQPKQKVLDHFFFYADPELFFGDATLTDHWRFGGQPLTAYLEWGVGLQFTKNLELRFYHGEYDSLGGAPRGLLNLMGNGLSLRYIW